MGDAVALILVFLGAGSAVWAVVPLLIDLGLEHHEGRYVTRDQTLADPMYRFTTPVKLIQACWAASLLGGGICFAVLIATGALNLFVGAIVSFVVGLVCHLLPKIWLKRRIRRRKLLFEMRLVDLTVGMVNGLRAGASLPQTLSHLANDLGGPVGEEVNLLLHEHRLGMDLSECFIRMCKRMPSDDLYLLVTAVRLTMSAGGSLATVMEKITSTIRERIGFQEKVRTLTAQGRFEAMAIGAAPMLAFGILYLVDSSLMVLLVTTTIGWIAITGVMLLEALAFFVINRIVTIEV